MPSVDPILNTQDYAVLHNLEKDCWEVWVRGEYVSSHYHQNHAQAQQRAIYNRDKARALARSIQPPIPDDYGQW